MESNEKGIGRVKRRIEKTTCRTLRRRILIGEEKKKTDDKETLDTV